MSATYDPNFPPNLDISPLAIAGPSRRGHDHAAGFAQGVEQEDEWGQGDAIGQYGIAGRVWEATTAMTTYLTPPNRPPSSDSRIPSYDPPCPLFDRPSAPGTPHNANVDRRKKKQRRIIELGSGQSVASLHLAQYLGEGDELVLTDLPEVVPLCKRNIERYNEQMRNQGCRYTQRCGTGSDEDVVDDVIEGTGRIGVGSSPDGQDFDRVGPVLMAASLPWGGSLEDLPRWQGQVTHILLCDLIYFPQLYPPLLKTLLELTEPIASNDTPSGLSADVGIWSSDEGEEEEDDEVFGPTLIMSYKPRTLENEQPFFDAISLYFRTTPVVLTLPSSTCTHMENKDDRQSTTTSSGTTESETNTRATQSAHRHNDDHSVTADPDADTFAPKLFIYRRWRTTREWRIPDINDIMSGRGVRGVRRGRDFGYTEQMFAALEWD